MYNITVKQCRNNIYSHSSEIYNILMIIILSARLCMIMILAVWLQQLL